MTHPVTKSAPIPLSMMPAVALRGRMTGDHDHLTADADKVASQIVAKEIPCHPLLRSGPSVSC